MNPLGFDPDQFLGYDYVTPSNVGDARVDELELNYRQALHFLPKWAEGLSIFANATFLKLEGANSADFGFRRIPTSMSWSGRRWTSTSRMPSARGLRCSRRCAMRRTGRLIFERPVPSTPAVARTFRYEDYGVPWTIGVKGGF